jgi:Ca2+-binding EF-hand superfamily protein
MGCIQSAHYHKIYEAKPELSKWESEFDSLMFTEADIGAMYYHFRQVDQDGGGTIDVAELLAFLDLEKTKFSKRIFSMFDEDESGQIDFREFVLSCWNYCSLGRSTLMLFAFDLCKWLVKLSVCLIYYPTYVYVVCVCPVLSMSAADDKDSSGEIDGKEVCQMLKDIYGKDFDKNTYAKKILERIFVELGEEITVTEFREFVRKYPALLFPAFQLQDMLQQKIMGVDFWKVFSERRMTLSGGKYIEIGEFMALVSCLHVLCALWVVPVVTCPNYALTACFDVCVACQQGIERKCGGRC